jgi:hypothetical protein
MQYGTAGRRVTGPTGWREEENACCCSCFALARWGCAHMTMSKRGGGNERLHLGLASSRRGLGYVPCSGTISAPGGW